MMNDHWKKKAQEARRNNLSSQIEVWREWKEDEQYGTQNIGLRFFIDTLVEEYERCRHMLDCIPETMWDELREIDEEVFVWV
tara:strand:- start:3828 stop:4073 length:246 start_codon:yes stop_codon:yes gene_type:complete